MQINPFGLPFGMGQGSGIAAGAAQPGFAEALGMALGTGAPANSVPGMLPAMAPGDAPTAAPAPATGAAPQPMAAKFALMTAPILTPAAGTEGAPAQGVTISVTDTPALPSLGTRTPLAQLMTTAARLPAIEQPVVASPEAVPAEGALPAALTIEAPAVATPDTPAPAAVSTSPEAVPAAPAPAAAAQPEVAVKNAAPAETPVTPRKPARAAPDGTAELPERAPESADAAVPQPLLAALAAQAPIQPQPQQPARTPARGEAAPALPGTAKKTAVAGTVVSAGESSQPAQTAGATEFGRAVESKTDAGNGTADTPQHEAPQPDIKLAAPARHEVGAAMPQPVQASAGTTPAMPAVAPAETQIAARPGHLGQQLGVEVARKIEAGEETLRVRLSPEHLGRVEVTLAFEDGKLQATVRAESSQALDLLRQDAPDLARTLDQAGIRTDAQSLRFEARADGGSGQAAGQQHQQSRGGQQHQQHAAADDLEPAPAYRTIRGDGQVDLLA